MGSKFIAWLISFPFVCELQRAHGIISMSSTGLHLLGAAREILMVGELTIFSNRVCYPLEKQIVAQLYLQYTLSSHLFSVLFLASALRGR